jgi:thioredoxin reductase
MKHKCGVIIIGGGPTGVALGIELGLNNINTLILKNCAKPFLDDAVTDCKPFLG